MPRARIGVKMSMHLDDETVFKIKKIAKYHKISVSEAMRIMIETGIDSYDVFSIIGLPQLAELTKRVRSACTSGVRERVEAKTHLIK